MSNHADARLEFDRDRALILQRGDITRVATDAIVNAANSQLARGGGVSGAIHAAGGPQIARECTAWVESHGEVAPGGAAITSGGRLPAHYVIHAVGPLWHGGDSCEARLLASAYRASFELADEHALNSIAYPSISTGIFGYPAEKASCIALQTLSESLETSEHVTEVRVVLYDESTYRIYSNALGSVR